MGPGPGQELLLSDFCLLTLAAPLLQAHSPELVTCISKPPLLPPSSGAPWPQDLPYFSTGSLLGRLMQPAIGLQGARPKGTLLWGLGLESSTSHCGGGRQVPD